MYAGDLKRRVLCGIVLYNPDIKALIKNISALYSQVDKIVLIDNNSDNINDIRYQVDKLFDKAEFVLNPSNNGIAAALNQIMKKAYSEKYEWFLTMDQDSICDSELIKSYDQAMKTYPNAAVYCPFILNNNKVTYDEYKMMKLSDISDVNDPIDCITSGSLVKTNVAVKIGGYTEKLFIDCVDVDFNIRLQQSGYHIIRANRTYMFQSMGKGLEVPWMKTLYKITKNEIFKHLAVTPVYNNKRLFFIARNSKYIRQKYGSAAGKRMTKRWMAAQFIYYSLTYPLSRNRILMWANIRDGYKASKGLLK